MKGSEPQWGWGLLIVALCAAWLVWTVSDGMETDRIEEDARRLRWSSAVDEKRVEHPDWPWNLIDNHEVWIGMNEEQAFLSLWQCNSRNTTTTAFGVHVQRVYDGNPPLGFEPPFAEDYIAFRGYLYFENGVLVTIQTGY